ncbi:MAG TPA: TolC family protein [Prolixibacteraceae bacterium]|nr:TolC family protein [Prolixibacteraceae bacterium]
MNFARFLITGILLVLFIPTVDGETYLLNLEESIAIAKMKSLDMQSLKQDLKIAEYNLRSATSRFKTHIDLNLTTPNYTETIRQFEDSTGITFYSVRQSIIGSNLTINQPLPTDGRIYITSGLNSTDDYNEQNRWMRVNTRLGFSQPIDALYGYNNIRSAFKTAQLAYEESQKRLKREELNLVYSVSFSFFRLLSVQKREEIARMNLDRQKEAFDIAKNKYAAGLIREVDALQMEVDLAEAQNNYDLSLVDQQSARNNFKQLIGIALNDSVIISSEMDYKIVEVDVDEAVERALANRLELRESDIQIELNKLNIKRQKAEGMITGDLNAYYEKIGVHNSPINNEIGASINQSLADFQERPGNFGIGLSINIPIIDWGENKALVKAAEARLQKNIFEKEAVIRDIETEVKNLVAALNSSLKRLQLLERNVLVAEKSFEITRARYSDGDIDSQLLALERVRLNNAYTSHLDAYIAYELNLSDLMRKTFYDYKNNQPVL